MPLTISLTNIQIRQIYLDYDRQVATVLYSITDAANKAWINTEATFFVTMPPQNPIYSGSTIIGYEQHPDTWFQLPASYLPTLISLKNDAMSALTNRFLP